MRSRLQFRKLRTNTTAIIILKVTTLLLFQILFILWDFIQGDILLPLLLLFFSFMSRARWRMSGLLAVEASNVVFPPVKWEVLLTGTQLCVWSVCMQYYRKLSENRNVQTHWGACAHVCAHVNAHTNTENTHVNMRARARGHTHIFRKWKRANERELQLGVYAGVQETSRLNYF